jgi:uncharacterized protein YvpB
MLGKFLLPKPGPRKYQPWHGYLVLAVIAVALVLGVVNYFGGPKTPTSTVPSQTWRDLNIDAIAQPVVTPNPVVTQDPAVTPTPAIVEPTPTTVTEPEPSQSSALTANKTTELSSANLAVPFTSQAPTGVWDALHEDACEEASIYMVHEYFAGVSAITKIDSTTADTAIISIVNYGETNFNYGLSIDASQIAALIEKYYPTFQATVTDNPTVADIKVAIDAGHPVIVPAAGRLLGNPNFTGSGPLYHMLVIRGYDATHFITNDPGTRLGQNYNYTQSVLMTAIHDWNNGDVMSGTPRIIIMTPKSQ